jgi:hypothetical protein
VLREHKRAIFQNPGWDHLSTAIGFDPEADLRASAQFPRFTEQAIERNRRIVQLLTRVAARKQATRGQIALSWLLHRKPWIVPIPGTIRSAHLQENVGAMNVQLTTDDIRELEDGFVNGRIEGKRAPVALLGMHDIGVKIGSSSAGTHGSTPLPRELRSA